MDKKLWARDWFAALVFSLIFVGAALSIFSGSMQSLERAAYDFGVRGNDRPPSDRIAVIAIDEQSIANLGRWPWPRNIHAALIDKLHEGGAKVIGSTVFYSEPSADASTETVGRLMDALDKSPLTKQVPVEVAAFSKQLEDVAAKPGMSWLYKNWRASVLGSRYTQEVEALRAELGKVRGGKSADTILAESLKQAGNVILPIGFELRPPENGATEQPMPDYVQRSALTHVKDRIGASAAGELPFQVTAPLLPVPEIGAAAAAVGHLAQVQDAVDGYVRQDALVLHYGQDLYPSLALRIAAAQLELQPDDISVRLGEGLSLAGLEIRTDSQLLFNSHFYRDESGHPAFPVDSFYDVIAGKIRPSKYKGKIVLIGATARGVGESFATPVTAGMPPVLLLANIVSSVLQQHFYTRPAWADAVRLGLCAVVALYLALVLPRLAPALGALISMVLLGALVIGEFVLMTRNQLSLPLTLPALLLISGYGFMLLKRLRLSERLKAHSETESAESNRMLGLAFQTQGQLDMAFDKFRRVQPVDTQVLDLLYNLGLDLERKRQFNKAEAVYQYMSENKADYRDVPQKLARAKKLADTVLLGGATSGGSALLLGAEGGAEKAKLGRYEIEKELGKGAMGVVYLGRDPMIGRQVAIKTMALSNEFEADELASVKARFFREAESAGRLQHPNIVAIYDAGEEHDLAYIAMELLKGHDLTRYTKPDNLLPLHILVRLMADAADALDYAHANGVVHRDIKPANMMWLPEKQVIKLTDFGIARISDASKTRTGLVLGSPSYMSPEQLRGQKVDGRSDLFSLGASLYQLLTGHLPFQADSLATLMLKIVTEKPQDPSKLRPGIPAALVAVIEKAMTKDREQRYQRGAEMAKDLRNPPRVAAA